MLKNYFTKVSCIMFVVSCLGTNIYAQGTKDSSRTNHTEISAPQELSFVNTYLQRIRKNSIIKSNDFGYDGTKKLGLFKNEINVSGVVRFITIFRDMGDAYNDMSTAKRNISFLDQPLVGGGGAAASGGYPMLELNLSSKFSKNTDFNVGYSFIHFMTGNENKPQDNTRYLSNIQNLRVGGNFYTGLGKFAFQAGSILPAKLSKFSMGQPNFRDDYFDRLPWDWYRNSFQKYDEYYNLKTNMGGQNEGRSLFSGVTMNGTIIPLGLNFTALYGRTSYTVSNSNTLSLFPGIVYGGRLEKTIFTKDVNGKYAFNYYRNELDSNNYSGIADNNEMITLDADMQFKGLKVVGEIAYAGIHNSSLNTTKKIAGTSIGDLPLYFPVNNKGLGFQLKTDFTKKLLPIPLSIDMYMIQKNVVSFDGSILNSNSHIRTGGLKTEDVYDVNLLCNVVQEIGQYANNRMGIAIKSNFKIQKLTIDVGFMISQELENVNDSVVTVQHRVNAFTRSRFHPWYMDGGPYNRVRSVFRRTYENIGISVGDPTNKKAYNAAETMLMYKFKFLGRELVLMNFHTFSTALSHMSFGDNFNDNAYTRQYYTDGTVVFKAFKKVTFVGSFGLERLLGGKNTDKDILTGGTVNQTGTSKGLGIDYDFLSTAGLHLRHKWFSHNDTNFTLDKFNGTETTLELKLFF